MGAGCGARFGIVCIDLEVLAIEYFNAAIDCYVVAAPADEMISCGHLGDGYGPLGVAMCVR